MPQLETAGRFDQEDVIGNQRGFEPGYNRFFIDKVGNSFGPRGASLHKSGELIAEAEPPTVAAIDTVGAGDAFTAALVVALVEGQEPINALRFACAAGAAAATRAGAQPSLPTRAEVETLL